MAGHMAASGGGRAPFPGMGRGEALSELRTFAGLRNWPRGDKLGTHSFRRGAARPILEAGALFPSFCDLANGILPPASFTWTWATRKPPPGLQWSREGRATNDFPGASFDPAGLWPKVRGLLSFRLGILLRLGLSEGIRPLGRNSGSNSPEIPNSPEEIRSP